jgi:hypothetical protein
MMTSNPRPAPSGLVVFLAFAAVIGVPLLWVLAPKLERLFKDDSAILLALPQSKPVEVNGVAFAIAAPTDWLLEHEGMLQKIQLRVTNNTDRTLLIPTFDTFSLQLFRADGRQIDPHGGRDWTEITNPITIRPGQTGAIQIQAKILKRLAQGDFVLSYVEGSGTWVNFMPLQAGDYEMSFVYAFDSAERRSGSHQAGWTIGADRNARWEGSVETERLKISLRLP